MAHYRHTDLDPATNDLRLVTLLPGEFHDDIEIQIRHGPLVAIPNEHQNPRISIEELTKTLPAGWTLYETLGGRYIFENDETEDTFWSHPDPEFPRNSTMLIQI
jgi:hypothetical protein